MEFRIIRIFFKKIGRLKQKKKTGEKKKKTRHFKYGNDREFVPILFNMEAIRSEYQRCDATKCGGYVLKHSGSIVPGRSGMVYLQRHYNTLVSEVFNML